MKERRIYKVNILGAEKEISVINNKEGRYMCMFNRNAASTLQNDYKAYGFMVWTQDIMKNKEVFYPIELGEETKLTPEIMHNAWMQIRSSYLAAN